jgi:3-phosphoshikimate 1-carboxyvinyltransferase
MLRAAGAAVRVERERPSLPTDPVAATIGIEPAERIALPPMTVPGDLSSAAFHLAAGLIVPGADVRVTGVGINPTRIGLLGILNRMGADVEVVEQGHEGGEPVGSLRARGGDLRAALVAASEVATAIDELPLVGLLGCFAEGTTKVDGAAELRHKESDRIAAVVDALNSLGGEAEAFEDGFAVTGTGGLRGGEMDSRGDHRLAMLGAVAGLASREGVTVRDFGAARISYPGFEGDLRSLLG